MDDGVEWHQDYESLFFAFPVQVPQNVLEHLSLSSNDRQEWPKNPLLPELSRLLDLLESFICDSRNWMKKRCSESEMASIEEKLNGLMVCLQCQKQYGRQFWRAQPRRVQASIIHAYIFLKMLIDALIPHNYFSLMHANSEEKLMTEIFKLENLINEWIQLMRPIHTFMHFAEFASQRELTESFFSEMLQFFKGLPRIHKTSMAKPPKIMEFISVCLQIETCKSEASQRGSSKGSKRRSSSGREHNFINRKSKKQEKNNDPIEFFRFDERIRVHTTFKRKKLTITSIETKEKSESNDKSRSPSLDRSLSLFESDRMKRGTFNESPKRDGSNSKIRSRLLTSKTNNTDVSRERSRRRSIDNELVEQQRDSKVKKKKAVALPVKVGRISEQLGLDRGACRGWGIIREYVQKKIVQRKLQRLLLL